MKNNFSLIYELLDEVIDNGYPQSTDPETLKVITQMAAVKGTSLDELKQIASQVTGQIGWRRDGIKYKKNEIYLDVRLSFFYSSAEHVDVWLYIYRGPLVPGL